MRITSANININCNEAAFDLFISVFAHAQWQKSQRFEDFEDSNY